jgi:hypothetical protein
MLTCRPAIPTRLIDVKDRRANFAGLRFPPAIFEVLRSTGESGED